MKLNTDKTRRIMPLAAAAPDGKVLDMPQLHQQTDNWCWAACAEMVLRYFGHDAAQSKIAERYVAYLKAHNKPHSMGCADTQCAVSDFGEVLKMWGVKADHRPRDIAFSTVRKELDAGRPVIVLLDWFGSDECFLDGHFVIICGWHIERGEPMLKVNNPSRGTGLQTYADLVMAYGQGVWKQTWVGLTRTEEKQ